MSPMSQHLFMLYDVMGYHRMRCDLGGQAAAINSTTLDTPTRFNDISYYQEVARQGTGKQQENWDRAQEVYMHIHACENDL